MFPPQQQQQQPQPMGGPAPAPQMGGAGGMQPQGPAASPMQPAVPPGAVPLSPQQQQMAQAIQQALAPQELEVVKQCLTPELMAIVVKLFGPQVSQVLDPLVQVANSNQMMDSGDDIGGVDIEGMGGMVGMGGMAGDDEAAEGGPPQMGLGSVSSPFRGVRAV